MSDGIYILILALVAVAFFVRWFCQWLFKKVYRTPDDTPNYLGGRK